MSLFTKSLWDVLNESVQRGLSMKNLYALILCCYTGGISATYAAVLDPYSSLHSDARAPHIKMNCQTVVKEQLEGNPVWDFGFQSRMATALTRVNQVLAQNIAKCQANCDPQIEVTMIPLQSTKDSACQVYDRKTRQNPLSESKTFAAPSGCDERTHKAALSWARTRLHDTQSIFWKECPNPCSHYVTYTFLNHPEGSCTLGLSVVCSHPKNGHSKKIVITGTLCR